MKRTWFIWVAVFLAFIGGNWLGFESGKEYFRSRRAYSLPRGAAIAYTQNVYKALNAAIAEASNKTLLNLLGEATIPCGGAFSVGSYSVPAVEWGGLKSCNIYVVGEKNFIIVTRLDDGSDYVAGTSN